MENYSDHNAKLYSSQVRKEIKIQPSYLAIGMSSVNFVSVGECG